MDDSWLTHGHGSEPTHLDTIFTSSRSNRPVSLDLATDTGEHSSIGRARTPRRSSRVAVVTALWFGIFVGTSGAAWAVRDALFPSIGPAEVSVWQNPGHDTDPPASDDDLDTTVASTATSVAATPTEASTATSIEQHESDDDQHDSTSSVADDDGNKHGGDTTQPTVGDDTPSSVDDHGGGQGGSGPSNDTAPDDGSGSGKGSDSGGGSGSGDSGSGGGSGSDG